MLLPETFVFNRFVGMLYGFISMCHHKLITNTFILFFISFRAFSRELFVRLFADFLIVR